MTETAKTNVIKEPSLIVPKRLTAHKIIVKATGEVIEITNDHRITYGHLEDQFRGLTNPKNIAAGKATGHFYSSNENLAIQCGVSEYTFKKVKKDLKALGLIDWKTPKAKKSGHACEYFVKQLSDIAHNLEFIYQELPNGQPSYDHVRVSGLKTKKTKKIAQPIIEESENGAQSVTVAPVPATNDPEQQSGVSQPAGDSGDDVPANDAVNERYYADLDTLNHWVEGHDNEGFISYGAMWGIAKPGAITDLIKSHIRKIQSDGYKGSRSAANDEPSGADAIYKQQQAQRAAAAKRAANAQHSQGWKMNHSDTGGIIV
ncbi:hypothetical protein AAHD62_12600 [Enterobacter hormaechei]